MSVAERDLTPTTRPVGRDGTVVEIAERRAWQADGFLGLLVGVIFGGLAVWMFVLAEQATGSSDAYAFGGVLLALLAAVQLSSLTVVPPGRTRVVQFFGRYVGTVRRPGLVWTVPLSTRRSVSVRVRNFETARMKVNDASGNPVEIAAIVVWQVADTAKASFAVEEYDEFVETQSEAAVRHVAGTYPYDGGEGEESLRGSTDAVSGELAEEVAARVSVAGVEIVETRISHLAYAPEIAQAMLQRQQANAVVAARARIVEGAVGMVEMALERLEETTSIELDEERKASMVSNLLVVLCGDARVTPVVNTGTLYQ
ncbi:SPFH domain-containing protein [Actinotalea sp. M2MS4P-6]|uniref:SPFH domain-containing protein n=1 Tax=Actinotalea sp. M2MS4P-6 TaxID=2983762 RepID=UPI0021E45A20|nr:SPFH domain-containing protein [Actinotalea sp. M2MS4P-6]MCV2395414.1 SPFH domain-containing protein [Actinotalea sp. M2MS4P-6]